MSPTPESGKRKTGTFRFLVGANVPGTSRGKGSGTGRPKRHPSPRPRGSDLLGSSTRQCSGLVSSVPLTPTRVGGPLCPKIGRLRTEVHWDSFNYWKDLASKEETCYLYSWIESSTNTPIPLYISGRVTDPTLSRSHLPLGKGTTFIYSSLKGKPLSRLPRPSRSRSRTSRSDVPSLQDGYRPSSAGPLDGNLDEGVG